MRSMVIRRARNLSPVGDFIPASSDWDRDIPERSRALLMVLVKYNNAATLTSTSASKPAKGIFAMAVKGHAEMKKNKMLFAGKDEVDMYFSGISPRMASMIHLGNGMYPNYLIREPGPTFSDKTDSPPPEVWTITDTLASPVIGVNLDQQNSIAAPRVGHDRSWAKSNTYLQADMNTITSLWILDSRP
ncbi:hypothetical protein B0H14DRAFT_2575634 [Mycena olivaceomarginata]|nr:hypothetical protein B0H14DRAFT_2575634 [Mycena olivaceomarginata]